MRTLYFDIDGTLILEEKNEPKSKLADGHFEVAVRRASFDRLICVGNFSRVVHLVKEIRSEYDAVGALLGICRGVFSDERWFRSVTSFVADPAKRFEHVDLTCDWWYVDDLAAEYVREASKEELFMTELGRRIFMPSPTGDGQDVLNWLGKI
jgi:hypothetical protein